MKAMLLESICQDLNMTETKIPVCGEENLLVRIKLQLKPDGSVIRSEILDHARMNKPGQGFYKVLAESALRAIQLCQPLRVPTTGYERWKDLQLNFDAREMLEG